MKKFLIVLGLVLGSSSLYATEGSGIEVVGKASVAMVPDQFSFTVHVRERGKSATKTKALVDSKSKKIINMLVKYGVKQSTIDSSKVRMFPIYEKPSISVDKAKIKTQVSTGEKVTVFGQVNDNNNRMLTRFEVSRTITVELDSLSTYDQVLDQVVKIGVSHVSPLNMSFRNSEALYQKALFLAIENAKNKALKIAEQAGVQIRGLISLKESPYHSPSQYRMASESSANFASQVSEKLVSAQVIAIYKIAQ